jgi:autotransporter-associated beta strand protein
MDTYTLAAAGLTLETAGGGDGSSITGSGAITLNGNVTVNYTGSGAITSGASIAPPVILSANRSISVNNDVNSTTPELTMSGIISGAFGITKLLTGTLVLSGTNTYTGITTISAGTLSVSTIENGGVAGNLGAATNAVTNLVLGGGKLQYTGADASTNRNYTLSAGLTSTIEVVANTLTISGASAATTGALTKTGAGTLILSGANLYTGLTTVSAGTLQYGVNAALSSGAVTVNGGTLDVATFNDAVGAVTLTNGSIIGTTGVLTGTSYAMQDGTVSAILAGAVALTKSTAGTVTLSGANTYTGLTTVSAGVLNIQNNTSTGTVAGGVTITAGAALQMQGGITVGNEAMSLNGTGISNDGALRNISGDNTWGGTITINSTTEISSDAGVLTLDVSSGNSITGSNDNLLFDGNGDISVVHPIATGTGTLTKSGGGTLTLSGANSYTGATSVSAGVLNIRNNTALGTTAAGTTVTSGAALQIQGDITVGAEALTLDGTGISSDGALRNISGNNTWGGTITINSTTEISSDAGVLTLDVSSGNSITGSNDNLVFDGSGDISVVHAIATGTGTLTKSGVGTLTLAGANTYTGATTINAGTLEFGIANALSNGPVILNGGTLSTGSGAGFGDTVGTIALTDNSTIALGTNNHTLTFSNSSGVTWTTGKVLTITGWTGTAGLSGTAGKIVVGAGGLSSTQLSQINFQGYSPGAVIVGGEVVPVCNSPVFITCPSAVTAYINPTSGLQTYLPFNETSGTNAPDGASSNNGTLVNGASWSTGELCNAVSLAGGAGGTNSNYVSLPGGIVNGFTDFSISAWVYLNNSTDVWSRIFDFGTGTTVNMFLTPRSGSGTFRFAITTSGGGGEQQINSGTYLASGAWHHVAVTLNGTAGVLYVDGISVGTNPSMTLNPSSLGSITQNYIGKSQYPDPFLNGKVDEFRIYNRALSSNEVKTLAITGTGSCGAYADLGTPVTSGGCGTINTSNDASFPLSAGSHSITWTATDGNTIATCNQTVTVVNNFPPPILTVSRDNFCSDDAGTIDLSSTACAGSTLDWFTGSCDGTSIGSGNPLTISSPTETTTYYARWVNNGCVISDCASITVTVNATPSAPTTTGGLICIGSTATLTASGGVSGDQYRWYDAATSGNILQTSTSTTYTTPVLGSTTNYWVSILNTGGCEGTRTQVTATFPSISADNQNASGTDSWIGHTYDGTNFNTYFGSYVENETFDQSFGGSTTCFNITSNSITRSIYTESFSVKYKMTSSRRGLYVVDLGSDDKSRLTVDGYLIFDNWIDQAWTSRPRVLVNFTGSSSLLYEYTENGGQNRVVFQNLTQVLANNLSTNTSQTICMGSIGSEISGDAFGTLPTGITLSGTGYQWAYSTASASGPWTDISGATSATYTPSASSAPFNAAGTYYLMRKAILLSASNNTGVSNYLATNVSNAATLIIIPSVAASVSIGATATTICGGTSVTFTATPTNGGTTPTYQWKLNGSDVGTGGTTYTSSALTNSDQVSCVMTSNVTPCVTGNPATSNIITMNVSAEPTIANAGPDQTDGSTCGLTSVVLAANTPTVGTGAWSIVSGVGGSFGNAANPGSSFSGNPGSTYTLRWTISNLPCASSSDETTVTFNIIPTITGTSPAERCGTGSVTLGATASAGVINWYNNPTGGSSLGTGTSFATPVISNSTTYYVDATSNGCTTSSRTAVLATVHVLPTITVSPDVAICSGSNTTLTAGGGSSYVWSPSSGLSSSSGTSVTASPTATTTYTVTGTDSNGCSNTASTTVTVNELPTFSSVAANCAPDLLSYSVLVTVSSGSLTSTEGTVVNTSGNNWTVSSIPTGTNTTLTVADANSCLNTSVVTAPDCSCPTINAPVSGGNHQYCTGSSVPEISASVATGETVDWYSVSSGGTSLSTGLAYTPSSAGTYYAEARNTTSNCKSSTRTAVTITENPNASISLTSASGTDGQTVCINSPIDNITYLVGGGGTNAGVTGLPSGLSGNFNAGVFTISGSPTASGTFNYTVTTTGTCSQTSANGTVTVDQATVGGTISGGASSICLGTSTGTLTLSGYTGTIVRWERQINSGGWNSVGSGGSSTFSETPYSSGTWEYRVVVQNGVCAPEYSSVFSLNIDPTTAAGWITSSSYDPICEGASTPTLTLNGSTGSILRWEKQLNSGAWQNIANTTTTFSEIPTSGGTWGYRALVQSGTCPSAYQTPFTVVVNPTLTITLGSDPEICEGTTIANISYTATTGNPASYSIDFDPAANTAGFSDFSGWGFSASPLSVNVPWNAVPGDYYGSLTIGTNYPVCTSQVYPVHIKVNPNLPVSVSIAADANPICAGTNVTFTATPANGGASPSYQWKKNGGNVGSNSSTYTDATLANDDQITCVLTSNATCATGSPATSNTVTMTVNPNLPVSVSIGASANPICAGTSVTFTATPTNGGLNPTYQWKKNGGNVGSNSTSYTDAALANGDQITCDLTSDATCATGNPATSNTVTMVVNSFSVAPTAITGTTTICAGGSTTLTLSGGTAGTGATAEWFTGSCGGTSAGTGNSITVSPASSTTYYVRYNGTCNTTTCASVFVTVNSLSVAPTAITGTTTICAGGSTTLTLSGGTPGTGATAEWFTGSCGGTSAGTGNSITVSPVSSTTYYVRYNGTCNTTSCASVLVTVFSPSVAPTGISGTTTICAGGSTTLTLSGGTAGTGAIAEWFTGSCGGTSAGTGNSITVSPASSTTYYVRYSGTCNTTTCVSVFVTVNSPSVAPTGITGTTTICAGGSTTLTLSGGTPGTGATAEWFTGSCGGTSAGTGNSITVSPASSTTYYVRYNGTCNTTSCASVLVTVNLNPTVSAGIAVAAICQGSNSGPLGGSFGGGATSAVWSDGGAGGSFTNNSGSTPGTATYTASITSSSSVTLTLTTNGGSCGTTSDSKQITVNPIPTPSGFTTD